MGKHVLLHGGGFESSLLLLFLSCHVTTKDLSRYKGVRDMLSGYNPANLPDEIYALHMNYGHLAAAFEREAVRRQCMFTNTPLILNDIEPENIFPAEHIRNNLLFTGNPEHGPELPSRNKLLIGKALAFNPDITNLWIGAEPTPKGVEPFEDCTRQYLDEVEKEYNIKIHAPLLGMTHDAYISTLKIALQDGTASQVMFNAMTCWTPKRSELGVESQAIADMHCDNCKHCEKRNRLCLDLY